MDLFLLVFYLFYILRIISIVINILVRVPLAIRSVEFNVKVRREGHRYLQEAEMREEGGTPAIVESVRAGLVFQLKESLTTSTIMSKEHTLCRYCMYCI